MKLPFKIKLFYGIGGTCDNALYMLAGTYLLLFLTTVAGISPAVAGAICAAGSIWEALCAPIVGFESDHAITRFGRRKPFLLCTAIPVAVITTLLFTAIDASPTGKVIYYLVMVLLYWTCFSSFFVPYMAWGSDLTDDYNERTVLRSFSYIFNQVGMCIGMVLPSILVDYCVSRGKTLAGSWTLVGLMVGVCGGAALLICAWSIKNDDKKDFVKPPKQRENILQAYATMFKEYWQLMPSMIYDVCEVEELLSGVKHSGAVISLQALSESISIAVGLQMLGVILELAGFNSELSVQMPLALEWVENAFVVIPGGAMVLVALIIRRSNLTKEVFDRVKEALARRHAGEDVDISEFEEIFE